MKVGIYLDLRNAPMWPQSSSRMYGFVLEMCEEAERLGAGSIWLAEHHMFEDGYLTQPLIYAAAIAARTKRVRIGTAIVQAPLHPAIAIAEQATVIDLVSNGRFELGLGSGYRVPEFALYGADFEKRFSTTRERAREIRAIWSDPKITPVPAQARIPIWMGTTRPKNAHHAGLLGEGLLAIAPHLLEPYRQGLIEGGHDPLSARMTGVMTGWFPEDPDEDWPIVSKYFAYWLNTYQRHAAEGTGRPAPPPVDIEQMRHFGLKGGQGNLDSISFLYAAVEDAAKQIRAVTDGLPVEHLFVRAAYPGMSEETVARNLRIICTKLAPLLCPEHHGKLADVSQQSK
jgi:alkanesulfonate monooxygenase SsuD/methylene tetrahydromethanopterin reductase-like flavin-dependent oxidoreductase (luciferase family)